MRYQHRLERGRRERLSRAAHATITALVTNPQFLAHAREGIRSEGDVFAAFMLVPHVAKLSPKQLDEVFDYSFRVEGIDYNDAIDMLIDHLEWREEGELEEFKEQLGLADPLDGDDPRLREAFERRYEFIFTEHSCFVFDREEIPVHER